MIDAAVALLILAHPKDKSLHRALRRGATVLQGTVLRWSLDIEGHVLQIESSKGNGHYYHADEDSCECPASSWCWHRGCFLILKVLTAANGLVRDEHHRLTLTLPEPLLMEV